MHDPHIRYLNMVNNINHQTLCMSDIQVATNVYGQTEINAYYMYIAPIPSGCRLITARDSFFLGGEEDIWVQMELIRAYSYLNILLTY